MISIWSAIAVNEFLVRSKTNFSKIIRFLKLFPSSETYKVKQREKIIWNFENRFFLRYVTVAVVKVFCLIIYVTVHNYSVFNETNRCSLLISSFRFSECIFPFSVRVTAEMTDDRRFYFPFSSQFDLNLFGAAIDCINQETDLLFENSCNILWANIHIYKSYH